ncbi:glucosylceramidase-like [Hyposmocoma kahamanoa]|uniref:glucosylceramidase-like n=1 Tax=Hyposmocoma kahamanoa TaxID=1477025 RepID=UPI000E6D8023|nr:glucosylceramidase-like [Hyposmocoma kahamanoa]
MRVALVVSIICALIVLITSEDRQCQARNVGIPGRSIVCVCNAVYCDSITRENPAPGTYVVYTSSYAGQRFEKSVGNIEVDPTRTEDDNVRPENDEDENEFEDTSLIRVSYRIFTNTRFQFIEGFGGSITDAASINWRKLSRAAQTNLIESYFGPEGIEYNLIRIPIAGCDFSTHPYTYNEYPWHDAELTNYTLSSEDYFYRLPMLATSLRTAREEVKITASAWSPPIWMKTNERITGFGQLRPQYYQAYADYHLRFLEELEKMNIKVWAITTTNEPINGIVPLAPFNSLGWLPSQLARWVANNLGPTIRNSRFNQTKIFAVDDQRYLLHYYVLGMEREDPKSIEYIDGIAVHYYGNFVPASILSNLQNRYPNKMLLSTEACEGPMPWDEHKVELGSWDRARNYVRYILQDLNNFVVGWIDWNLCLDPEGGPNWANNFVDAPILVYGDQDEFIKQPMFYAMGHFSKFIPRGSRRIQVSRRSLATVENLAVIKPNGHIVVVLQNANENERIVHLRISATRFIELTMEARSVKTIEINPN